MPKYIIDENLPYYFNLWHNEDFIHVFEIKSIKSDAEIWAYAKENKLTIVTKDADFSNKIIFNEPPPKVIHIRIGNLKLKELHELLTRFWMQIEEQNASNKLVILYSDRIESIN